MRDDGWKIAREAYSSEVVSIIINIFVGLLLTLLILPRASFNQIVIMVPALLSARGNISGSYSARVARDLIIGQFKKNLRDNMISTVFLSTITGFVIGGIALVIAITIVPSPLLPVHVFFLLPILSMSLTMVASIPISTSFNHLVFKRGMNPSNIVPPIMTSIDDILIIFNMFLTIALLGVP